MQIKYKAPYELIRETYGSIGLDIRSDESLVLKPGESGIIKTGLFVQLPNNFEMQIRSRSGISAKKKVMLLNGIGTIDSDYRGEIMIPLMNFGDEDFHIIPGDRIAQAVFKEVSQFTLKKVNIIDDRTLRNVSGFGSTGR